MLARVEAAGHDAPGELAAVEVRDEAAGGAQERRLARRRQPGRDDELARRDVERHVAQRRLAGVRVAVRDVLEAQDAHRTIPRRSANGSSATTTSATASSHSLGPAATTVRG